VLRGDLSETEQKVVWATHAAPAADLFNQKVKGTLKSKPSWYIVARTTTPSNPSCSASWRSGWALRSTKNQQQPRPHALDPGLVIDVIRTAANAVFSDPRSSVRRRIRGKGLR